MKISSKQFYEKIKKGGVTLRGRFVLYVASGILASVMLLLLLLSLFGILNPADSRIETYLDNQLENHAIQTEHDIDKLAAYSVSFSKQMETVVEEYLTKSRLTFDKLTNNIEALTALQKQSYETVYTNIRVAPCSGAFYMLNTTVNNKEETPYYNGVYIKFANLYADSTINTKVALFRGSSEVARTNNINLSSTWQNEMRTDVFDNIDAFAQKDYIISGVTTIPDTWERARYIYSPIYGKNNQVIGICGFELSDLYMQLAYDAADSESGQTVVAFLDKTGEEYKGQFISNRSGYVPPVCETITVKKRGSFHEYRCGIYEYIGKEKELLIDGNTLTIAMMFPEKQYNKIVYKGQVKNIAIFFIIALVAYCVCIWLSKKYIMPIKKGITQLKTNKTEYIPSGIAEIDDLFAFLAEQDRKIEEALAEMENQKIRMQNTLEQVNIEHSKAMQEIARLAYSRKTEVDPDDYEQFVSGVKTLTQMERTVFDLYLAGKKVKEIVELLNIKESTVRFHNRNIYSKLGVNSLKQLLLYASVMNHDEKDKKPDDSK